MIAWMRSWWETFRVWWETDPEVWDFLKNGEHDPEDFIELGRPQ